MASRLSLTMLRSNAPLAMRPVARRSLHASSSVSRKKAAAAEEYEEDFDQPEEEDLFAVSDAAPVSVSPGAANSQRRQAALDQIKAFHELSRADKKAATIPSRVLATVLHATENKEEAEELKAVLRMWRVSGLKETRKATDLIIGRCCQLGAPEVAVELISDRVQYGLAPPTTHNLAKIHQSLLEHNATAPLPSLPSSSASPSVILLRLALLAQESKGAVSDVTKSEVQRLVELSKRWTGKTAKSEVKWATGARERLVGLGAEWKAAAESLTI